MENITLLTNIEFPSSTEIYPLELKKYLLFTNKQYNQNITKQNLSLFLFTIIIKDTFYHSLAYCNHLTSSTLTIIPSSANNNLQKIKFLDVNFFNGRLPNDQNTKCF